MSEWKPVSEAPLDGTRVELRRHSGDTRFARWIDLPSLFRKGPQWWDDNLKLADVGFDPVEQYRPASETHP